MNFRENLRFLMDSQGLQVKELSARTGISENTLKSYLKESSAEPKVSKAVQIADALGVSVEFLATGRDRATPAVYTELLEIHQLIKDFPRGDLRLILAVARTVKENRGGRGVPRHGDAP